VRACLVVAFLTLGTPSPASAQHVVTPAFERDGDVHSALPWRRPRDIGGAGDSLGARRYLLQESPGPSATYWSVLASAALPGAGQVMLRQQRFIPYLAIEAFSWTRYLTHRRDGRKHRDFYRELAANVARRPFTQTPRNGDFEYYERMEHFTESGAFDAVAGGLLDPEPDTTTFNGSMWLLARRTYWLDIDLEPPRDSLAWRLAEAFYRGRAVSQEFRWSWRNAQPQHDEFRRTIRQSNDAFRSSLQDLGFVIANHVLSTVDAYVSVQLRRRRDHELRGTTLRVEVPFPPW
jgi:hypothetical protein